MLMTRPDSLFQFCEFCASSRPKFKTPEGGPNGGLFAANRLVYAEFYLGWTEDLQKLPRLVGELDGPNPPQAAAEIPWEHNLILLAKLKTPLTRIWHAHKAIEHRESRAVLAHHIETQLHQREGNAVTNFRYTLPPPLSDLAEQTLKDPYNFDFLTIRSGPHERDLEQGLLGHIQKFLLEVGAGFAFVGPQYHMEINGQNYYLNPERCGWRNIPGRCRSGKRDGRILGNKAGPRSANQCAWNCNPAKKSIPNRGTAFSPLHWTMTRSNLKSCQ
jgi:predicted nuclease of restriction endonuclease-like (RecB) superfamily